MTTTEAISDVAQDRMVRSARTLLALGGIKAVTARAVAQDAGASASAMNYHFGGKPGLLAAAFEASLAEERLWRAAALDGLAGRRLSPSLFPDWLAALLSHRSALRNDATLIERELFLQAERLAPAADIAAAWEADVQDFFSEALAAFGVPPACAGPVAELYHAIPDLFPAKADPTVHSAWSAATARHFGARLVGGAPEADGWRAMLEAEGREGAGQRAGAASEGESDAKARILDATIALVAREGAAAVTHRAIAAEADVALSATTRHFSSRAEILRAAFERLYLRIAPSPGAIRRGETPGSSEAMAQFSADSFVDADGNIWPELIVIDELILAARRDPELSFLALHLVASRGRTSVEVLGAIRELPWRPTRTDAFVWSLGTLGSLSALRLMARDRRRSSVLHSTQVRFDALFGGPQH